MKTKGSKRTPYFQSKLLDSGAAIYKDADNDGGRTVTQLLEDEAYQAGEGDPAQKDAPSPYLGRTPHEISVIKRGLKRAGKAAPPTALEKQFANFGISLKNDRLEKFFAQTGSTTLFPEFVQTAVVEGFMAPGIEDQISARRQIVGQAELTIKKLKLGDEGVDQEKLQLRRIGQGAEIPYTELALAEETVKMVQVGRGVRRTYAFDNAVKINAAEMLLRRIGKRINIDQSDYALNAIINGDGNASTIPANIVETGASGTITLNDLISFWRSLPQGFNPSVVIWKKALAIAAEQVLANFPGVVSNTRRIEEETKATRPPDIEWDRAVIPEDQAILIDSNEELFIYETNVLTEADKLISRQWNRTFITKYFGVQVMDANAVAIFDTVHV